MSGTPTHETETPLETLLDRSLGIELQKELAPYLAPLVVDLGEIDARLTEVLHSAYPQLEEAALYACRSGGKRLRPLLMAIAARALGQESTRRIHSLAAAFQLIHTATLVHDDVIDHAELRRGRPSVARAFGLPAAIVTGDYLFVRAFQLAAEYPRSVVLRCGEACADLAEGEVLQETARFDLGAGRAHYARVIERKTAAIVSAALASVAEISGSAAPTIDAYASYGRSVGMAYQIRDDLLDLSGDPDLLGKPLYSDLREGNPTLVTIVAHELLAPPDRQEFERLFSLRRKQSGDLLRLRELVAQTEAIPRVEEVAEQWRKEAVAALTPIPLGPYRSLLEHVAFLSAARPY